MFSIALLFCDHGVESKTGKIRLDYQVAFTLHRFPFCENCVHLIQYLQNCSSLRTATLKDSSLFKKILGFVYIFPKYGIVFSCFCSNQCRHLCYQFKTGVINDPLGQPTDPAGSDCCLILKFWDGRTDTLCENSDHYPQGLWSVSWINISGCIRTKILFTVANYWTILKIAI